MSLYTEQGVSKIVMKIAIDVSAVVYGTGVSTYTQELVRALISLDKKNEYILFGGSLRRKDEINKFISTLKGDSLQGKTFSIPPSFADLLWNRMHLLPIEKLIGKVDVFHSSDWTQPPSKAYKVTTVHDLAHVKFPELIHPKISSVHTRRLKWVKKEVDRIIVPSLATKNDLLDLGFEESRIVVIHEGVDGAIKKVSKNDIEKVRRKFSIQGDYLLSVGANPRKNTARIITALKKLKQDDRYRALSLVVVGQPSNIDTSDVGDVNFVGHISDKEFPVFYAGAKVLVYPSLYEGFGIPILDAFKMGLPVVTSNIGSMAEVAGDAAVLVDPGSEESISKGIVKAIDQRESLISKGYVRVKQFSWEKAASETLNVYNGII